jgi:predicted kinase
MSEKERTIYLTIGFLGSGKSTWAKKFAAEHPDTKIVSGDGFRTMLNGEYKYLVELDDIITSCMLVAGQELLWGGYDVIIDCGNLTRERRNPWLGLVWDNVKVVAVVFPSLSKEWHIANRLKNPHGEGKDWDGIAQGERDAFEPIDEKDFDKVIYIEEWKDE